MPLYQNSVVDEFCQFIDTIERNGHFTDRYFCNDPEFSPAMLFVYNDEDDEDSSEAFMVFASALHYKGPLHNALFDAHHAADAKGYIHFSKSQCKEICTTVYRGDRECITDCTRQCINDYCQE